MGNFTKGYLPKIVTNKNNENEYQTLKSFYTRLNKILGKIYSYLDEQKVFENISDMLLFIYEHQHAYQEELYYHFDKSIDKYTYNSLLDKILDGNINSAIVELLHKIISNELDYYNKTKCKLNNKDISNNHYNHSFELYISSQIVSGFDMYDIIRDVLKMDVGDILFNQPYNDIAKILAKDLTRTIYVNDCNRNIYVYVFEFLNVILSYYINNKAKFDSIEIIKIDNLIPESFINELQGKIY